MGEITAVFEFVTVGVDDGFDTFLDLGVASLVVVFSSTCGAWILLISVKIGKSSNIFGNNNCQLCQ